MSNLTLEERVALLEAEVARLKQERTPAPEAEQPWWKQSPFKNDPVYKEVLRLGREYRESLRPKDEEEAAS